MYSRVCKVAGDYDGEFNITGQIDSEERPALSLSLSNSARRWEKFSRLSRRHSRILANFENAVTQSALALDVTSARQEPRREGIYIFYFSFANVPYLPHGRAKVARRHNEFP